MRVSRHQSARLRPLLRISSSLLVIPAALTASSAGATPTAQPAFVSQGGSTAPVASLGHSVGQRAGHSVAPTVKAAPIASVSSGKSAGVSGLTRLPASATGELVAHVRRPVVHRFSMVAVTWAQQASPATVGVEVRTRYDGHWSSWTQLVTDGDGPSAAEDATVRAGTAPLWVKHATGVEVAVYARGPRRLAALEVDTIDPGTSASDSTLTGSPSSDSAFQGTVGTDAATTATGPHAGTFPSIPTIVTRAGWGADESLGDTCWDPKYGTTFKAVIVHHTAGSNDYTKDEAAAVVRGILAYHTVSRGWCDIGYNFLIDRYGTIYEGRAGGIRQPVRGAHGGDYNVDTTGISLMGNFDLAQPTRAAKHALVQLIAWRLGAAYHGAYGRVFLYDGKFNRISGHRDVMQTSCPGRYVYAWLPTLRQRVEARLGDFVSAIEASWRTGGGKRSDLGPVRVGEEGENGGRHTIFRGGRMYDSASGLFTFDRGPVLHRYVRSGETGGGLGYPASGVRSVSTTGGLSATFAGGRIYWSDATGSRLLRRGAILKHYLQHGAAAGELGFPVTEVYATSGGTRARFESGVITYDATTRQTTVTPR